MSRRTTLGYGRPRRIVGLLAAGALVLPIAHSVSDARALATPATVRVTDRLVKHIHVDVARKTRAGSFDFYRQLLLTKRAHPTPIGHSDITCINTGTGSKNCSGTYFLPMGKIMVQGVLASRLFYQLAVVGGTGLYDNARGTMTATYFGGDPAREFLLFRLEI